MKYSDERKKQLLSELQTLQSHLVKSPKIKAKQKRSIEAMLDEEFLLGILSALHETVIVGYDYEGSFLFIWGPSDLEGRYGIQRNELVGKSIADIFPPHQAKERIATLQHLFKTGESLREEYLFHSPGGDFWHDITLSPMRAPSGETVMVVGFIRDITKQKEAERGLDQHRKHLEKLVEERSAKLRKANEILKQKIIEHKKAEEALRETKETNRDLVENINEVLYTVDKNGVMTYISPGIQSVLGYSPSEIIDRPFSDFVYHEDLPLMKERFQQILLGDLKAGVYRIISKSGEIRWFRASSKPTFIGNKAIGVKGVLTDITDQKRLEDQLHWSQKMETVGRLAGGVAHDFNNLLTAIGGHAELGLMRLHPADPLHGDLQEILRASDRAAKLTHQLLVFSRHQIIDPKVVNLNEVLVEADKMLRRLVGEDVELVALLDENLGPIRVDPGQFEQVIVNLAVNARDAMAKGGKLTIETANVALDEAYAARHVGVAPGEYVMLSVTDTGVGMTEEVKEHIFEPFFTTKEEGKGSGLGLATCYAIIKQSGGNIWVYSESGKGTTFKMYLPRVYEQAEALPSRDQIGYLPRGTETVLLVEDELSVRNVTARTLRAQGYTVLEAGNGDEALRLAREYCRKDIHLLLTDVVMPQMGGRLLAERLSLDRPSTKVLFFSGYPGQAVVHHGMLDSGVAFLHKPFSPGGLVRKVREVLNS